MGKRKWETGKREELEGKKVRGLEGEEIGKSLRPIGPTARRGKRIEKIE
ncbi:MAG: hypothetical protein WBI57_10550 [Desulfobacterales bacterium]